MACVREGIAQPGGIVASGAVRDDVLGKLPASFAALGEQMLKNIDRPIQAYTLGNLDEAIRYSERAIRLNPRAPTAFFHYALLTAASFAKSDHIKTLHWGNQTIALKPDYWVTYAILSASFVENGDLESARHAASRVLEIWPDVTISRMREAIAVPASWGNRFDDGMIAVGIPV